MVQTGSDSNPLISIVVPIYNEAGNVRPLLDRLASVLEQIECHWEIVFAMDPSPDGTREEIVRLVDEGRPIRLVTFSRRIGKPLSLMAGLEHARGDACITLDADLQDPPELIVEMVTKWRQGFEVVIAQRASRQGENWLYLKAAGLFYRILERISEVPVPRDTGDFRLMDARVLREILRFRERHGFLRGIGAFTGFKTALIPFHRDPRLSGKTQISIVGAINIALDGIIPFSRAPVRAVFRLGASLTALSVVLGLAALIYALTDGIRGLWNSAYLGIWFTFLTGLTITSLGIIGEYVLRTYEETRDRPLYIVDEILESQSLKRRIGGRETPIT